MNYAVSLIKKALRAIGYNPSEVQVMDIVNKYDVNADGKIDNGEWKQICNSLSQNLGADYDEKLIADIKENFQLLAKGQSTISTSEYETNGHQTSAYTHIHTRAQTCIHIISRAQGHCFVESKLLHS